jgi:thymidylate synthase (FAD)
MNDIVINLDDKKIDVGNAGFVKLVDCMPRVIPQECKDMMCDYAIVQAARVSLDQGIKSTEQDSKLIDFLLRNKHTSPFEMVKLKFHVKCPIFIQRQWIRHRTASVNEISGRYSVLKPEFYIPEKIHVQGKFNKQMSGEEITDPEVIGIFNKYIETANQQYIMYNELLKMGVSKETARIGLPLNMYTEFYWCIDLHNLLNFIRLRSALNAQPEIKLYSDAIKELIRDICPHTIESFEKLI